MKTFMLAAAMLGTTLAAPAWADPIAGLFNTGVDANGQKLPANGAFDTHYVFTPAGGLVGTPAVTYTNGAYLTDPNGVFIAPSSTGAGGSGTYSLSFTLLPTQLSSAQLSGSFAADNGASVFLNGTLLTTHLTPAPGDFPAFQSLFAFSAGSAAFTAGINVLSFQVTDYDAPTALLVTNLQGTTATAAVPEPATWGMMILGFGAMGYAMRRRAKVRTTVSFA